MFLVKNGVPYDLAFGMDDDMAFAHYVVFVESEGVSVFDWEAREFVKRE